MIWQKPLRYSLQGHTLSAKNADGGATLTLYNVTANDKEWIDGQIAGLRVLEGLIYPIILIVLLLFLYLYIDTSQSLAILFL